VTIEPSETSPHRVGGIIDAESAPEPGATDGSDSESLAGQVHDLEHQNDLDKEVISDLVEQGVLDRAQIDSLETALATCRRIGAAMGILMSTEKITEAAAFGRLREVSQGTHRKLRDVASDVLSTGMLSK
jgi:hypothetical protein